MPVITKLSTAVVQANFNWTYVRVYSDVDGGLYGTGESFFAPGLPQIVAEFADVLVGEDFNHVEKLVEKMRWAPPAPGRRGALSGMRFQVSKPLYGISRAST
jgi:L-alanine-DL-glutamate epimerase-like enolase superfamily enzyme